MLDTVSQFLMDGVSLEPQWLGGGMVLTLNPSLILVKMLLRRYRITISLAATLSALTTALGGIELLLPCAIAKGDCCMRERWCVLREIELVEGV